MSDVEAIAHGLESADPEERRRAAALLAGTGGRQSVVVLMKALGDEDWRVRKEATSAAMARAPSPDVLAALVQALGPGDNVGLRNAAVEALGGYGAAAVSAIADALSGLDADGRKLAAEGLARTGHADALEALRTLIPDTDANVRAAAVEAVSEIGLAWPEAAVPLLEACLASEDRFQSMAALDGLNRLGVVLAWERIESMLDDPVLRRPAIRAAGHSADPRAAEVLARSLETARGSARREILEALVDSLRSGAPAARAAGAALRALSASKRAGIIADARPSSSDVLPTRRLALVVAGLLGSGEAAEVALDALADDRLAAEADEALVNLGRIAVPKMIERVNASAGEARAMWIDTLGRFAETASIDDAVGSIREALADESSEVVRAALSALAAIGDKSCLRAAAECLRNDASPLVRQAATLAVSELARRHKDEALSLARSAAADGPDAHAAIVVIGALGEPVRGSTAEDVAFLSQSLSSESTAVRRAALEALSGIGGAGTVEAVAFALTDEEREVRLAAVRALGRVRSDAGLASGVDALLGLVERPEDPTLVAAAIRALGDTRDGRALDVLRPLARHGEPMLAVCAVEALAEMEDHRRADALVDALAHTDAEVVKAALRALAEEAEPRVVAHLGACLDHGAWDVRRLAADLLGRIGGDIAGGLLRAKLTAEPEAFVRDAIQRALTELDAGTHRRPTPAPPRRRSVRPR